MHMHMKCSHLWGAAHDCLNLVDHRKRRVNIMKEIRNGYVPVLVGKGKDTEKIWLSIEAIHHPTVVELLDQSADELGYQQGLLRIIYDVNIFKDIIHNVSNNYLSNYICS
ncbi:hypothetical protein Fmac_030702 [Flemingia macrophylla]|uniref:Uncharacterized protein n=1 Tax=Flemingia macrophylla TaxID=520843 RepID=A0ABD1L001_9FABA